MKVSVITINYNNAIGIEKTILSVKTQSIINIEYIIIDGASTDGSYEVIQKNLDCLSYWVSEPDRGVYHAMNKGIQASTGDYLLFLNSGDTLVSEGVIQGLLTGEDGKTDLIYGNLKRNFPDGSQDIVRMPDFIDAEVMMEWTLCHPVTLIHKRLFHDFGLYDVRLKIVADWAFFLKVILLGNASQKHKDIVVANFAMDGISSLSLNQEAIRKERNWVKENYLSPAFKKLYYEFLIYKSFYNNKFLKRLRNLIKSLKG